MKTSRNYIDKQLLAAEYKKSKADNYKWSEKFGELLIQLHKLILNKPNFHNYKSDFKDDMMQYSMLRLFKGLSNFDDSRELFPYLYRAIHLNFWQYCKQWYKRQNKHNQYVYDQLKQSASSGSQLSREQLQLLQQLSEDEWVKH